MEYTAKKIAELINGEIIGDPNTSINELSKLEDAKKASLSFLANPKYESLVYKTKASILLINDDFIPKKEVKSCLIKVADAYTAFATLLSRFEKEDSKSPKISALASISNSALIGKDVYIGDYVVIEDHTVIRDKVKIYPHTYISSNVEIGEGTLLKSGVKIESDSLIGRNCIFHSGVVIGSEGFGFIPSEIGNKKIAQIGNVIIEDDVEVGANTCIDRATLGSTIIKQGVKLDNLIQIGHNVVIGAYTLIAAQTGIAGSSKIGKNCMIGGQVAIIGHISIADEVKIVGQSGVIKSITEKGAIVQGSPAFNFNDYKKSSVHFRKLNELVKRIEFLEKNQKDA